MLSADEAERRVGEGPVAFAVDRDVVVASGPDATTYLQGQLSQDVSSLAVGDSRWSLLLQPQGKVDTWLRITRLDGDRWVLDTDAGAGAALVARLERFKLRTDATFEPVPWSMVAVRGPGSGAVAVPDGALAVDPAWPAVEGVDLLAAEPALPAGVAVGDPQALEVLRIRAGVPAMGRELTERTIPAEAGIVDRSVSFTKGCYVGQELVARIDSRGNNTPRRLYGLILDGGCAPAPGSPVLVDGVAAGEVTSAAVSVVLGPLALAYVRRGVEPGAGVEVDDPAGVVAGRVVGLPFGQR